MMEQFIDLPEYRSYLDDLKEYFGANYSNDSFDYSYEEGDVCDLKNSTMFEAVFLPTLYSLAFIVGILGSALLLGVMGKSRKTWSKTDNFLLHLAGADILVLVTLPFWAVQSASGDGWVFGTPFCKITGSVFTISFYCKSYLLACISVDYYLSAVHSTKMFLQKKHWVVHACCVLVWIFSLLLSVSDWIFLEEVMDERENRKSCVRQYEKASTDKTKIIELIMATRWLYHAVGFLFPSAVLVFCYSCILLQLQCGSQSLQKQRAFKVIIALVPVFFICWTPYNVVLLADTIQFSSSVTCVANSSMAKALTVTSSLGYLHCCLNPILLVLVDVKFRRQAVNLWVKTSDRAVF
ncbi:C-X-C chemokine receptor type 3-like [Fundulus diaphanus]